MSYVVVWEWNDYDFLENIQLGAESFFFCVKAYDINQI